MSDGRAFGSFGDPTTNPIYICTVKIIKRHFGADTVNSQAVLSLLAKKWTQFDPPGILVDMAALPGNDIVLSRLRSAVILAHQEAWAQYQGLAT
jgi:hypothetical protein